MFNPFRSKSVAEQIENALDKERVIHAQQKRKLVNDFNIEKAKEITDIENVWREKVRKKNEKIKELNDIIKSQRDAFRAFKEHVIQNETIATELAAESEIFLEQASRVAGVFASLRHRAEYSTKKIEKQQKRSKILNRMEIAEDCEE